MGTASRAASPPVDQQTQLHQGTPPGKLVQFTHRDPPVAGPGPKGRAGQGILAVAPEPGHHIRDFLRGHGPARHIVAPVRCAEIGNSHDHGSAQFLVTD